MKLSSAELTGITEKPSLFEAIESYTNCNTTTYPYADRLRDINSEYFIIVGEDIIPANSKWTWDDTNKTDLPIGIGNLVDGQQNYALPSDLLKIIRILK